MDAPSNNPDLPLNAAPGSYFYISAQGQQPPQPDVEVDGRGKIHVVAYRKGGSAPSNAPQILMSLDDCETYFGARSEVRAALARIMSYKHGLTIYATGIDEPSAGTARTIPLTVVGTATGGGVARLRFCDQVAAFSVAVGDGANAVAAALHAAFGALTKAPATSGIAAPVVTLTAAVKGLTGNDLPVAIDFDDSVTGIDVSIGTLTLANASDGTGKALSLSCGTKSVAYTYPGANEGASTSAANFAAVINARGDFPLKATVSGAVLTLLLRNRRVAHRPVVATTDGSQTAVLAVGTAGAGTPDLTLAILAWQASDAMAEWVTSFNDATSLGSLVSHLESEANGYIQKEQFLTYGSAGTAPVAGGLAANASPSLNLYWRYSCAHLPDAFQPAYEFACLRAAARCAATRPTANLDYTPLTTDGTVNLTFPDIAVRPSLASRGVARATYYLTPLIVRKGQLVIESDITTYGGGYKDFVDSGHGHGLAYVRLRVNAGLAGLARKELVQNSQPRVSEVIELSDVEANVYNTFKDLEQQNLFDGADKVKPQIKAAVDPNNGTWIRCAAPVILPRANHVIQGQIAQALQAT